MLKHSMDQTRSSIRRESFYLYEGTFVLNISLVVMATIFLYDRALTNRLFRMDESINRLLHIPQTDLVLGYWALFLPGAVLAVCLWFVLKLFLRSPAGAVSLRYVSGIAALTLIPLYWLCARFENGPRYNWTPFHSFEFYELVLIVVLLWLFLHFDRNQGVPLLVSVTCICLYYGFWFWEFGTYYVFVGNSGAITTLPIVGLASALTWLFYSNRQSRIPPMVPLLKD